MNTTQEEVEIWRKWLPEIHLALARPDHPISVPAIGECLDLFQAQAYWECLEYLFRVLIGWEDIGTGLAWWYARGKKTEGDKRLELVRRHWDDHGQLDYYAAHHWRKNFSYSSPDELSPTDLSLKSGFPDLEWWRAFKVRGREYAHDPFYGGSNPLHLGISWHSCLITSSPPAIRHHGSAGVEYPSGVVIATSFDHWRTDLDSFDETLPALKNRSWRIEVFDREVGYLGLFRKSRVTGSWFQGRHGIHVQGRFPE